MEKLKVVFVPRRSRIRPYKMAKALKYTGKVYLVLVCEESFYDKNLFNGIFDEVHFFTKKNILFKLPKAEKIYRRINEKIGFGFNKMKRIINEINPDLVHCFAEPYNHIAYILKNTKYPVIMSDGADFSGITAGIENLDKRTAALEKYCFENVSGIVHKGPKYEIEYYIEMGYIVKCKEITWFDHCDDDLIITRSIYELYNSDEIHVVYTGNISTDPRQVYIYYIDFAKELSKQKIHFHIYPNPYQYNVASEYKRLSEDLEYFHFHKPLPYSMIGKEISKYDWGLWWHNPSGGKRIAKDKTKVAIGNKMFAYLESGLPIIVGKHNGHGRKIIEEREIGIAIDAGDVSNLKHKLLFNYCLLSNNVSQAANDFRLSSNADKLLQFYYETQREYAEIERNP